MNRKEVRKNRATWGAEPNRRETTRVKRKEELFDESLKGAYTDMTASANVGLTCTEANADSILSEGESV